MKKNILKLSKEFFPETLNHRRYLHQNPELSFKEINTTHYISEFLTKHKIEHRIALKSDKANSQNDIGVIAWIGNGSKSIALRADIDALPINEDTALPFRSQNFGIMHACGHDLHTSMLLTAAKIIKDNEDLLNNRIVFVFQPGEEQLPGGAKLIIESGILDEFNIQAFFGQHINPELPSGKIATKSGPLMASTDEFHITISGKSTHAAQPHLGADPIYAAIDLINFLYSLPNKHKNPLEPVVLAITAFNSGNTTNIVPSQAKLMGTMRTFNQVLRIELKQRIEKYSSAIVDSHNCHLDFNILEGYPPLLNNFECTKLVQNHAVSLLGNDSFQIAESKMWAEDFAYYSQLAPSCFWFLGCANDSQEFYPLHNSKLNPDEESMIIGTALMASIALSDLIKD